MPNPGVTSKRSSYPGTREDGNGRNKLSRSRPPLTVLNASHPGNPANQQKKTKSRSNSVSSTDGKGGGISGFFRRISAPPTPTEDKDRSVDEKSFAKTLTSLLTGRGRRQSVSEVDDPRARGLSIAEAYLPTSPIYNHEVTFQERQAEKDKVVRLEERSERRKSGTVPKETMEDPSKKSISSRHSPVPDVPLRSEKRPISQASMHEQHRPKSSTPSTISTSSHQGIPAKASKILGIYDQPGRLLVNNPNNAGRGSRNRESRVLSTSSSSLDEPDGYFPVVPRSTPLDIKKDTQRINGTSTQTSDYSVENSGTEDETPAGDDRGLTFLPDGREDFRKDANKTPRRRRNSPPPVSFFNRYRTQDFKEPPRPTLPKAHTAPTQQQPPPLVHRSSKFSEDIVEPAAAKDDDPTQYHAVTTEKSIILGSTDGIIPPTTAVTSARNSLENSTTKTSVAQAHSDRTSTASQNNYYAGTNTTTAANTTTTTTTSDGHSKGKSPQTRPTTADSSSYTPASRNSLRSITDNESFMGGWRLKQALQQALEAQAQSHSSSAAPTSGEAQVASPSRVSADSKSDDNTKDKVLDSPIPAANNTTTMTAATMSPGPTAPAQTESTTATTPANRKSISPIPENLNAPKKDETVGPKIQPKDLGVDPVPLGSENMGDASTKKEVNGATPADAAAPTRKRSRRLIKRRNSRPGSVSVTTTTTTATPAADPEDEKIKAAIAKGKEKALQDIEAHQNGKSSWSLLSGFSSSAVTESSASSSIKTQKVGAASTVSISSDASTSSAFPASSSTEHSPPAGPRSPQGTTPKSTTPAASVRPKTPTEKRQRPHSMQIPATGAIISPNKSPIKAPKLPSFPASTGNPTFSAPTFPASTGLPTFPQPAGVPASSIGSSIPPVPPIPASQRQSYIRKDPSKTKVVSPLRNEIRGSPDSSHPKNMGILTPHLHRSPSNGNGLRRPESGQLRHRKSASSTAIPTLGGGGGAVNNPATNYSFSSPHTNGLPYSPPPKSPSLLPGVPHASPLPGISISSLPTNLSSSSLSSLPGPSTPSFPPTLASPTLPGTSPSGTTTPPNQQKPVAKLFVICCTCSYWHDLPSNMYIDMTSRGSVVRCPYCLHGMATACCRGYTCVVYMHQRHH